MRMLLPDTARKRMLLPDTARQKFSFCWRRDAGREERRRESKETQDQTVQLRRDRYTGHIQDAVYVTRPGLASDISGRTPRLPLLDKSPSDIVN